jgi:hypothetical protein
LYGFFNLLKSSNLVTGHVKNVVIALDSYHFPLMRILKQVYTCLFENLKDFFFVKLNLSKNYKEFDLKTNNLHAFAWKLNVLFSCA